MTSFSRRFGSRGNFGKSPRISADVNPAAAKRDPFTDDLLESSDGAGIPPVGSMSLQVQADNGDSQPQDRQSVD